MDPITFRLTRFQRRRHILVVTIYAIITAALAALLFWVGSLDKRGVFLLIGDVLLAGLTVMMAGRVWGRATFDQQGITTKYLGRVRKVAWNSVSGIDATMDQGRYGHFDERVRISLINGKSFKLPAPFHSTLTGRDPKFDTKLEHIQGRWRSAAEPIGAP